MAYAVIKLRLRATIGAEKFDSVVGVAVNNFGINQIPSGTLILPLGRNLATDAIAPIHRQYSKIRNGLRVKVFLTASHGDIADATPGLPNNKELLIFEGKVVGTGMRHNSAGHAQLTVHVNHWLADLDETSAISASSHPGNPAAWTYPAVFQRLGPAGLALAGGLNPDTPNFVPVGPPDVVSAVHLDDLWKHILLPRMQAAAKDDPIDRGLVGDPTPSATVTQALERMTIQQDGVPLSLETEGADAHVIAEGVAQALNREQGTSWINTTMWGKLVGEWAPAFFFSVVPRISDALIVPFAGGLRGAPWSVIGTDDYTTDELQGAQHRLLRAVGIVHPILYGTGIDGALARGIVDRSGCCGLFQPPGVFTGVILIKDAPGWLSDPTIASKFSGSSTGIISGDAHAGVISTGLDEAGVGEAGGAAHDQSQQQLRGVMDKVAEHWYVLEMLKGRTGEIGGKLRFDICPGSNIAIEVGQSKNIPANRDALVQKLFATVVSVSYIIDAEQQAAWTGFSLAHIRSEQENTQEGTSVRKPPLYKKAWRGASLIHGITTERSTR